MTTQSANVQGAVKSFIRLVLIGWDVQLACQCSHDTVYDEITLDEFITLCQSSIQTVGKEELQQILIIG